MVVLYIIAIIIFDAWHQSFHITKNRFNIPHTKMGWFIGINSLTFLFLNALYNCGATWLAVIYTICAGVLYVGFRTMIFDPAQNIFRGLKWNRETKATKGDIAKTDIFYRKFKNDLLIKSIFLLFLLIIIKLIVWLYFKNFT